MVSFTKKEQRTILLIVLIIVALIGFKFFRQDIIVEEYNSMEVDPSNDIIEVEVEKSLILVHVSGQVYKPGIVEVKNGDRVIDAIELAGGLKKDADIDQLNLAKKVEDEEKIYVPKIGEEEISNTTNTTTNNTNKKININTATKEELITLSGIGDALADRIIEYRKDNTFKTIDDIKEVSGIGDKKFEAIKNSITVK